jgi:oligopeptide transport system permease protein
MTSEISLEALPKGSSLWRDAARRLFKNRAAVVAGVVLLAMIIACILVPALCQFRYDQADLKTGPTPPSREHWMGTDYFGRDLLARVFFGGRISFAVGILATFLSFGIGITWGGVAGYFGGTIDAILMRVVDVLYTLPFEILVILLMVFFANDQTWLYKVWRAALVVVVAHPEDPSYFPIFQLFVVFAALGGITWLTMARIVRGQVLALRGQLFVEAARSIGAGHATLIFRHLIPNALGPIVVYATLTIPEVMMVEAFLSFLGLGTQEPFSSWGLLVNTGAESMDLYPWTLFFPALMLALTLVCWSLLGDGLRDALDPRTRTE